MILRARTLPTPGSDSSTDETFIFPTMSLPPSLLPSLSTSISEAPECLSRFFTAARSRRAIGGLLEGGRPLLGGQRGQGHERSPRASEQRTENVDGT